MAFLELEDVAKSFGETEVLSGVSLAVDEGETLVLLGPSGSGKTTLLRVIAGFETADRGRLSVGGAPVGDLPPAERNFGMVFQHYALFPHLSVGENVAFGLEARGLSKLETRPKVEQALERVDLAGYADRRIDAISGGQQQRVALARALAPEPRLLLLDEPLSNLDPELRERTRQDLAATLAEIGITAVWVTHEQDEAFDVGSRVAVLESGRLEQVGRPEELYRLPATRFVAGFVGRASIIPGRLEGGGRVQISLPGGGSASLEVTAPGLPATASGLEVEVYVRPEAWEIAGAAAGEGAAPEGGAELSGEVLGRRFAGRENLARVRLDRRTEVEVATERDVAVGERVKLRLRSGAAPPAAFAIERDPR